MQENLQCNFARLSKNIRPGIGIPWSVFAANWTTLHGVPTDGQTHIVAPNNSTCLAIVTGAVNNLIAALRV